MANPSDQFIVKTLVPLRISGLDLGFTNAALMMMLATATIGGGLIWATRSRALIPGRAQSLAEMLYEFVARTLTEATGREGMRFLPLIFSLFIFVLVLNLFGMVPGAFTVTSTASCGPSSAGSALARGRECRVPSGAFTVRPCSCMARRCAPRATTETSCPFAASRAATCPPMAPAP